VRKDRARPEDVQVERKGMRGIGKALSVGRVLYRDTVNAGHTVFVVADARFCALASLLDHGDDDGERDEDQRADPRRKAEVSAVRARLPRQDDGKHEVGNAHAHEPRQPPLLARTTAIFLRQDSACRSRRDRR
jgi:hypothetical protein